MIFVVCVGCDPSSAFIYQQGTASREVSTMCPSYHDQHRCATGMARRVLPCASQPVPSHRLFLTTDQAASPQATHQPLLQRGHGTQPSSCPGQYTLISHSP